MAEEEKQAERWTIWVCAGCGQICEWDEAHERQPWCYGHSIDGDPPEEFNFTHGGYDHAVLMDRLEVVPAQAAERLAEAIESFRSAHAKSGTPGSFMEQSKALDELWAAAASFRAGSSKEGQHG